MHSPGRRHRAAPLIWGLLAGAAGAPANAQHAAKPFSIEEALARVALVPPLAISADGEWIAYTLQDSQARESRAGQPHLVFSRTGAPAGLEGAQLWVASTRTGELRKISGGRGATWGPAWSPSGDELAYYSDRTGEPLLWIWNRRSGKTRKASEIVVRPLFSWELPLWLPDGRRLLIKALPRHVPGQQAVASAQTDTAMAPAPVTRWPSTMSVFEAWRQGGKGNGSGNPIAAAPLPWIDESLCDLAVVDLGSGGVDRIATNVRVKGYRVSPDGNFVAYSRYAEQSATDPLDPLFHIAVASLANGETRIVARDIPQGFFGRSFSWSSSGSTLSFTVGGAPSSRDPRIGETYIAHLGDTIPQKTTSAPHPPFAGAGDAGDDDSPPLWDASSRFVYFAASDTIWQTEVSTGHLRSLASVPGWTITRIIAVPGTGRYWSPDSVGTLYFRAQDKETKWVATYRVDTRSGGLTQARSEPRSFGVREQLWTAAAERADVVAYVAEDPEHDADIWIARDGFGQVRQLTHLNPRLERNHFGRPLLIDWRSTDDGRRLQGAVLLPPDYRAGMRYPMIVNVYGGLMRSNSLYHFGLVGTGVDNMQILATRGFVVLVPDAPCRRGATLMRDLAHSILPGITKAIDLGLADPDRIGLMGHSFGAYTALALMVQTRLFRAAVASAATGDLVATFGTLQGGPTQWVETGQLGMEGTPWTVRDRYIENSPVYYLDRVQAPLLLLHGGRDFLHPELAEEVFVGLRRLGKEVVYVRYEGEDHYPGEWGFQNQVDYLRRVTRWFEEHLVGRPINTE